jgi:squalene synthase HpnC
MSFDKHTPIKKKNWSLDDSYNYCAEVTARHYENFPVASLFLPSEKRPFIQSIYAFARIADDYADEQNLGQQERLQLLSDWEKSLLLCYEGKAEHPVFIALHDTVTKLSIPIELFTDLLQAFRMDVSKNRFENFGEILTYCKYSANPIGRLVLLIFGYNDDELFQKSDYICTALQLANFYQDVDIDLKKDRIYIPLDEIKMHGYNIEKFAGRTCDKQFCDLMKFQIDRAKNLFYQGAALPAMVDKDLQLELKLVWFGGMSVLRKIEKKKYRVFSKHITLNKMNKLMVLLRAFIFDDLTKYKRKDPWELV